MMIRGIDFTPKENELMNISDSDDHMYDQKYFKVIEKNLFIDEKENTGIFKVFTYKDSLRISVLLENSPCPDTVEWILKEIQRCVRGNKEKRTALLWYSQINEFSDAVLSRLDCTDIYHFYRYQIKRNNINPVSELKGLERRRCTEDMIDICIEVMEDLFTPFPDAEGSFRNDRERIKSEFLSGRGGTELFFKDGELVGFCGHMEGHFTELCVRREFQGKGYGEIIVRSTLKSVYESGYDAELTTGHYNSRAVSLYEKAGFKRLYESIRANLLFSGQG